MQAKDSRMKLLMEWVVALTTAIADIKKYILQGKYRDAIDIIDGLKEKQKIGVVSARQDLGSAPIPAGKIKALPASNRDLITNFLTAMQQQYSQCTRMPFFYVIRCPEYVLTTPGEGDKVTYWSSEYEAEFDTVEAFKKHAIAADSLESDELEEVVESLIKQDLKRIYIEKNMFLTETDAANHLKENGHNYNAGDHVYLKYSRRAPELEAFFTALMKYFKILAPGSDLCGECRRVCKPDELLNCIYKKGRVKPIDEAKTISSGGKNND